MSDDTEMEVDNPPTDIPEDKTDTSQESEKGTEVRVAFTGFQTFQFFIQNFKTVKNYFLYFLDSYGRQRFWNLSP